MISYLINIILILIELRVFSDLRHKKDIIKYYTYLQNFITLFSCIFYCLCHHLEFSLGLRYIATCGLLEATLVYILFLRSNHSFSEQDFKSLNPKHANLLFHGLCPLLSLISFVCFEESSLLTHSIWTMLAPIPSMVYWIMYFVFTSLKLWEEPYDFSMKGSWLDKLFILFIPISFIGISYLLWNI